MEFGVNKCAVMHVKRGGIVESEGSDNGDFTKLRSQMILTIIWVCQKD